MRGRWLAIAAVLAVAGVDSISPSRAEFRVCNKSKTELNVAIGYDGGRQGWIAQGWWSIGTDKCTTVLSNELHNRYYYLYADNADGGEWAGGGDDDRLFCIKDEKFLHYRSRYGQNEDNDCKKAGLNSKLFFQVDIGDYHRWTHTLEDETEAAPAPAPPTPQPGPSPPPNNGGNACQRYPNLC
jgi:uncharacterized membrane protein